MADLTTTYLGLSIPTPIVLASSSLSNRIENFEQAEAHGAGAVVLRSAYA
jgi:dihydroorotate dehydrogenase (fumarate)